MNLFKAHGLGNDYLVLETSEPLDAALVRALCDRHRGLGGDGILEPVVLPPSEEGPRYGLVIWNPDGSRAEKSGNGLRIFAWWLSRFREAGQRFSVQLSGGPVAATVEGEVVEVEMGTAKFHPTLRALDLGDLVLPVCVVDLGNPHCVVFRDEPDLDLLPWRRWGEQIERDAHFPNRTNVQFARCVEHTIELRVWERGAGPTLASGSSACAAAAAAVHTGLRPAGPVCVQMPGGSLEIDVRSDRSVWMRGPVSPVGLFVLDEGWRPTL